ncbi:MAG: nucleoside monophosphate kinase [Patescibacteria group bacterium]
MDVQTFVMIGRSGSGKGTQAELLSRSLRERDSSSEVFYLESGARFREFVASAGHSQELAKQRMSRSDRQPDFLAVWMWAHLLIDNAHENQHWIIDGTPRSKLEAEVIDSAFDFYGRSKPIILYVNVSRGWSEIRLTARGRADDRRVGDIKKRLDWFDNDVVPAIEWYRNNPKYFFCNINGEQSIEEVHQEIISKLGRA